MRNAGLEEAQAGIKIARRSDKNDAFFTVRKNLFYFLIVIYLVIFGQAGS